MAVIDVQVKRLRPVTDEHGTTYCAGSVATHLMPAVGWTPGLARTGWKRRVAVSWKHQWGGEAPSSSQPAGR